MVHGGKRWSCDWKKELDWAEGDNIQEQESGGSQIASHMMFSQFFGANLEGHEGGITSGWLRKLNMLSINTALCCMTYKTE